MRSLSSITVVILIIIAIVAAGGIFYMYNILNNNLSNIHLIKIYNKQNIPTPEPFQQDIAICNDNINIGPNFAYVNNATLFNQIDSDGQNVYFTTTYNSTPNIYSWYEGQLNYNGVTCDVWWINIPQRILANSNITIYMNIGPNNANYYSQYYPYVGANAQVIGTMEYDNGQKVFIAYGYFNNTFDGWTKYNYSGSFSPTPTPYGIEMVNDSIGEVTYILPPNNWNIPKIPLIVEEAWYYSIDYFGEGIFSGGGINAIALFGNTSNYTDMHMMNLPIYAAFIYMPDSEGTYLESSIKEQPLNYTYFPLIASGFFYSYLIVNSSYAQAGYYYIKSPHVQETDYYYSFKLIWVPLTLLDMYPLSYNLNYGNYTYTNISYNPYQYPTLEIGAGTSVYISSLNIEWVVARAYPPNGVMPSIYIS